jgi:hypothetical protein
MTAKIYIVHAQWDAATATWATNGEDIPGLVCETTTLEELIEVIRDVAPDLLRDNLGMRSGQTVDIIVLAERQVACIAA